MKALLLLGLCISLCLGTVNSSGHPTFSKSYHAKAVLYIPYAELEEPLEAWYDEPHHRSRIDYYGGTVKTIQLEKQGPKGTSLRITPFTTEKAENVKTCLRSFGSTQGDPVTVQSVVPDLKGFKRIGHGEIDGHKCEIWRLVNSVGDKVNNYTAYITHKSEHGHKVTVPVRYEMRGYNTLLGSHYDHYYVHYSQFSIVEQHLDHLFQVPNHLKCRPYPGPGMTHTFNPIREFIHDDVAHIDDAWDEFHKTHNKLSQYKSDKEHAHRRSHFHQNFRYIESMNRANLGYTLALNHLADRTPDEIRVLRGLKLSTDRSNGSLPFPYTSEYLKKNAHKLPESIDWRIQGAVKSVKDQSVCGSCWAFGTTGAIEGAYFLKYGKRISVSEQALVDCSWGYGNNGCDGGEDFRSYQWIKKHGIPGEADYGPYLGEDGYCLADKKKKIAKISGFVNIKSGDELALRTALVNHGPISISFDASHPSFSFYSSGVYQEPKCSNDLKSLDHIVLLVGYGTLHGKPYWLIRNSWSNMWGNDGYFLITRKGNNCGVATLPSYVHIK